MTEKKGSSLYNKRKRTSECSNYCRKHKIIAIFEFEEINSCNNENTNQEHFY